MIMNEKSGIFLYSSGSLTKLREDSITGASVRAGWQLDRTQHPSRLKISNEDDT
jgi:hypothetical protein